MIAKTKRLRIQALKEDDWKDFLRLDENPQVMRYIHQGNTRDADEVKAYVHCALEVETLTGVGGYFTIWEDRTNQFVGWICLRPESKEGLRYEIGYRLLPMYWGKGIATEASLAMVKKGFLEWEVPEIFARAFADNRGSIRIMEKIGLHFESLGENRELQYVIEREEWILKENPLVSQGVRISAKAIIERDGKLLVTENGDHLEGSYYLLPGGGQDKKETIEETLKRECMEELGVRIQVCEFAVMREYIGANHEFAAWDEEFHQVELMFYCRLIDEPKKGNHIDGDLRQIGFAWIPMEELEFVRIYPKALVNWLKGSRLEQYLGDIN
jgi:RimJ/RimL family protein N-acetyltransferase/8-oxo-dGTP pyrophosphatase MutT (NUDIX family)